MRIKRLDVTGFKSFPDKATLLFNRPVVGVVGPNGCGKSNIVDALRWVMGEQSVKALRGKSRDDIIFAGSESRAALGMAEVTVTFDNTDKLAPSQYSDFAEIAVTRKLYRDGNSDFMINNIPCRLRDITELFLGTGAGSRAYSIIEQGRISLIVSAKPEDRRLMIEEAAGITKYHVRKREAERKMDYTRQNLLRIRDIIAELKKQLNSLSRQAKKAERYKEYKTRIKELDLSFASREYEKLLTEANKLEATIKAMSEEIQGYTVKLNALETDVERRNMELTERDQQLIERQEALHRLDQAIGLDEQNINFCRQEIDSKTSRGVEISTELEHLEVALTTHRSRVILLEQEQKEALSFAETNEKHLNEINERLRKAESGFSFQQSEIERLKTALQKATSEIDRAQHRLDMLRYRQNDNEERTEQNRTERISIAKNHAEQKESRDQFIEALGGLKQMKLKLDTNRSERAERLEKEHHRYVDCEEELSETLGTLTKLRSRLDSLAELESSLEGYETAVKTILSNDDQVFSSGELTDVLARLIEVDHAYERAVGTVLGSRLQWVVVNGTDPALRGVKLLHDKQAGRAGFAPAGGPLPSETQTAPDGFIPLSDVVRATGDMKPLLARIIAGVYLADSLEQAIHAWTATGGQFAFVTAHGDYVDKSGAIVGGSGETLSQTLLARKRDMQDLAVRVSEQEARSTHVKMERDKQLALIRSLEGEVEEIRKEGHQHEIKILEQEKDLHIVDAELDRFTRRLDSLDREFVGYQQNMHELLEERRQLESLQDENREKLGKNENELKEEQVALIDLSETKNNVQQEATDARIKTAESLQRRRHIDQELQSAREREKDLSGRSETLLFERERDTRRVLELKNTRRSTEAKLEERIKEREQVNRELLSDRDRLAHEQTGLREMTEELKRLRRQVEARKKEFSALEMGAQELALNTRHLEDRVHEKYGVSLSFEHREFLPDEDPGDTGKDEMESLIGKVSKMGEVNLAAIKEHDEVSERYQFLCDQEDDLTASLDRLDTAIRKINRTTRKRLRETFEAVNENFSKLFPQLFGGGEARLEFTDPQDLLRTGVEIIARPPGASFKSVNLLSGGQKALTAISMIFAIFLYRPTPFCLLDEVDAPLDDVNISRFNGMLRRMSKTSQFIIITHNKRTMEISETLYGVTMEEPGISKIVSVNLT